MFAKISSILSLCLLFVLIGCEQKTELTLNDQLNFDKALYEKSLESFFDSLDSTDVIPRKIKENLDTLNFIYTNKKFQPIFIKSFSESEFVVSLLEMFNKATEHGLNPEHYHYTQIGYEFYESIDPTSKNTDRYIHLVNTELLITDAILKYSAHMRHGFVNPREIYSDNYFLPVSDSLNKKFFEPLKQNNVIQYLLNIQPKSDKYKKLQRALNYFDTLKNDEWIPIPIPKAKIEIGNYYSHISHIVKRLQVLGFIDTSKIRINKLSIYDSLIATSVKEFQKVNGLTDDGVIGKSTVERLNITPEAYINKIKLNLERFRWLDYSDTAKYILVNIPEFRLYAIDNGIEKFNMNVCTGKTGKWETLNMYGQISYFVLNPTWSVPRSIVEEEIVSGLRKDSSYLKKRNFKVYKSGKQVSLDGLTGKDLLSSKSYTLVQDPGLGNALGKIKFMFRNPFGIYLHDTPTRIPFKYTNRAVSHGCVRVEKPMQLAEYLLNDNSKWTIDFLKIEIGQKVDDKSIIEDYYQKRPELRKNLSYGVTTEVKLNEKIPVFIDYYTVWVDSEGKLNYRDDVYNKDQLLSAKLLIDN